MDKNLWLCAAVALILTGGIVAQEKRPFTAERHKALKITCAGCHEVAAPKEAAPEDACLKCHKSMENVAERTGNLKPNPHNNHLTEAQNVQCWQCHVAHEEDKNVCARCHGGMTFEKQADSK